MGKYLRSRVVRIGLALLFVGSGPLVVYVLLAEHGHGVFGIAPDPNPNPIGLGIPAMLTFWPSIIVIGVGAWLVRREAKESAERTPR